jgi:hypothetical protein
MADGSEGDEYVFNILRSCCATTVTHLILGVTLDRLLKGRPELKGWPLYTYYHSMIHTGILMPAFLAYFATTVQHPMKWLADSGESSDQLGPEHWVQTANIGFQVAITILSLKKVLASPALVFHHAVTILGCAALLHRKHCVGYGTLFTAFTECGSTMHNIMSLWNNGTTRWMRVLSDFITRGGGLFLILSEAPIARALGLPLYLQAWSYFGGFAWFGLNGMWTTQVLSSLLRKRPAKLK